MIHKISHWHQEYSKIPNVENEILYMYLRIENHGHPDDDSLLLKLFAPILYLGFSLLDYLVLELYIHIEETISKKLTIKYNYKR